MGYSTCFCLEIRTEDNAGPHAAALDIIARLRSENEHADYALDESGSTFMDGRWYDHNEDLKDFSKKHPDALFVLYGDGEDSQDFWCSYYRDGRMQHAPVRMEYDDYDESKLE